MEIEFVTLGDACERLGVPAPTLRNWTDQLEEFQVHFVMRNNRNERIYYDNDLHIFSYIRDLKHEHGRKTTMKDIANMLLDMQDRFQLRSEEDAPSPVQNPSNKTQELINADDVQRLMENQRVRALLGYMIGETTRVMKEEMLEEINNQWIKDRETLVSSLREEVKKEMAAGKDELVQQIATMNEEQKKRDEEHRKILEHRDLETLKSLTEALDKRREDYKSQGFFSKLFGKK